MTDSTLQARVRERLQRMSDDYKGPMQAGDYWTPEHGFDSDAMLRDLQALSARCAALEQEQAEMFREGYDYGYADKQFEDYDRDGALEHYKSVRAALSTPSEEPQR